MLSIYLCLFERWAKNCDRQTIKIWVIIKVLKKIDCRPIILATLNFIQWILPRKHCKTCLSHFLVCACVFVCESNTLSNSWFQTITEWEKYTFTSLIHFDIHTLTRSLTHSIWLAHFLPSFLTPYSIGILFIKKYTGNAISNVYKNEGKEEKRNIIETIAFRTSALYCTFIEFSTC